MKNHRSIFRFPIRHLLGLGAAGTLALTSCEKMPWSQGGENGGGDPGAGGVTPGKKLDPAWPLHFCSTNVESNYPTSKAVPHPDKLKAAGGSVEILAHPDSDVAQLRMITLPLALHATKNAARALAESGAIQDGDILIVFRKEWSGANAYGNVQLGQGHAALATVQQDEKGKYVHTIESPLSYSSPLDHPGHYGGHKTFQVIRPNLNASQKENIKNWAKKVMEKQNVTFVGNYGAPYFKRETGKDPISVSIDLAMSTLYNEGKIDAYCSEMVWALLGLRNINPDDVLKQFPEADEKGSHKRFISANAKPIFDPIPAATKNPLSNPGLMQGPDVVVRQVFSDDAERHEYLATKAYQERDPSPSQLDGIMSSGHQKTAEAFKPKLAQLRQWYAEKDEAASFLPTLNAGVNPNYSPTSYTIIANSNRKGMGGKVLHYVGTVTFK